MSFLFLQLSLHCNQSYAQIWPKKLQTVAQDNQMT